jgi:P27 family predicted phage terminase small subunit
MVKKSQKPALHVVSGPASTLPEPPTTLGEPGRAVWRSVMADYAIVDSGGLAILEQACAALDCAAQCAEIIAKDGPMIATKHGPKDHPLLRHETANRALACRLLTRLGLDVEPVRSSVGRPSGGIGWTG